MYPWCVNQSALNPENYTWKKKPSSVPLLRRTWGSFKLRNLFKIFFALFSEKCCTRNITLNGFSFSGEMGGTAKNPGAKQARRHTRRR